MAPRPTEPLRITALDKDHCVATLDRTLIHIWRHATTPAALDAMIGVSNRLLREAGDNVTCLTIVEKTSPPPEAKARDLLASWSKDVVPKFALSVMVADGGGFRGALVRGVGITLSTLLPHRVPFRFASDINEAIPLFVPLLTPPGADGVRNAVKTMREKLDQQGA